MAEQYIKLTQVNFDKGSREEPCFFKDVHLRLETYWGMLLEHINYMVKGLEECMQISTIINTSSITECQHLLGLPCKSKSQLEVEASYFSQNTFTE